MVHAHTLDPSQCLNVVASPTWDKVRQVGECHIWEGARNGSTGYGHLSIRGRIVYAHRVAWVAANGQDIPKGLVLDHLCRIPACVNPSHLEPITQRENIERGRTLLEQCSRGHALTEGNLRGADHRSCLTCHRDRARNRSARVSGAARALGMTRDGYVAVYGTSMAAADAALGEGARSA